MGGSTTNVYRSHVKSVAHALELLDLLAREKREMSLTEISRILGRPKSTIHGLIVTLRDYYYVDQSPVTGFYRLGVRCFELGNIVSQSWDIKSVSRPVLHDLNARLGEMVQLATEDKGEVLYLDQLDSSHLMRIVSVPGARLPMHCTGLGKALLAYKTPAEIKWILSKHGMQKMTAHTITEREQLERELIKVRRQGYALDDREIMDSIRCVAAPVFDRDGNVKYAISVSGLPSNLSGSRMEMIIGEVLGAAERISHEMGYRKPETAVN